MGQASLVAVLYFVFYLVFFYYRYRSDFYLFQTTTLLASVMVTSYIGLVIGSFNVYYCFWLIFVYVLVQIIVARKQSIYRQIKKQHIAFIFFFVFFTALSIVFIAQNKGDAVEGAAFWIAMVLTLYIFFMETRYSSSRKELFFGFCILIIGVIVLALPELLGINLGLPTVYRSSDVNVFTTAVLDSTQQFSMHYPAVFFGNTNNFAVVVLAAFALCFCGCLFSTSRRIRIAALFGSCLSLVIIVFTTSEIGFASLSASIVLAFILVLIRYLRNAKKILLCLCLIVCLLASNFLCMTLPPLRPYYTKAQPFGTIQTVIQYIGSPSIFQGDKGDQIDQIDQIQGGDSTDVRVALYYQIYKKIIKQGNYLGLGPGHAESYLKSLNIYYGDVGSTKLIYNPHSFLFEILGDYGVLGLAAYLILMLYVFVYAVICFVKKKKGNPFVSLFCIMIIFSFFLGGFAPSTVKGFPMYFAALGIAVGYLFYEASSKQNESQEREGMQEVEEKG